MSAVHPRTVVLAAWQLYRNYVADCRPRQACPFDRKVFAQALTNERYGEKKRAERLAREAVRAEPRREAIMPFTPRARTPAELVRKETMNAAIDALKYLSFRYPIARMELTIRERYARTAA